MSCFKQVSGHGASVFTAAYVVLCPVLGIYKTWYFLRTKTCDISCPKNKTPSDRRGGGGMDKMNCLHSLKNLPSGRGSPMPAKRPICSVLKFE